MYSILVDITARTMCQYAITGRVTQIQSTFSCCGQRSEEDFYAKDRNIAKRADMRAAGCHHMLNQSKTKPSVTAKELPTRVSDVLSTL